jgi:hypothetical protein
MLNVIAVLSQPDPGAINLYLVVGIPQPPFHITVSGNTTSICFWLIPFSSVGDLLISCIIPQ